MVRLTPAQQIEQSYDLAMMAFADYLSHERMRSPQSTAFAYTGLRTIGVAYAFVTLHCAAGSARPRRLPGAGNFGARLGCAWRETDEQDTDRETVLRDIISGQYAYPIRIVALNVIEGWSRDATEEIADALAERAALELLDLSPALQSFIHANASRPFGLQLALPLGGAA